MLVLTRKADESIRIGNDVVIKVIRTGKGTVKLGIEAPGDVRILRGELIDAETEPVAADADDDEDRPFVMELDVDSDDEFALPQSVAYGGYVELPALV